MAPKPKDIWDVVEFFNNVNRDARVASGDVEPMPGTGEFGLRTMGRGISMLNDSVNPYANTTKQLLGMVAGNPEAEAKFAKSLAKDVAITAAGFGVGKVAGKTIKAVTSRPMYYGIHGTSTPGLSRINPQIGENVQSFNQGMKRMGDTSVTSPKVFSYKPEVENILPVTDYAQMAGGQGTGSLYLVKTPLKNVSSNVVDTSKAASATDAFAAGGLSKEQMSSKAMKVVKEFPMKNYTKRSWDSWESAWEETQDFGPLSNQIRSAIQADKSIAGRIIKKIKPSGNR